MLSKKEFDILILLKNNTESITQRTISQTTGYSLGSVNKLLSNLYDNGLIDARNTVTDKGLVSLSPYKVSNAVIMAAGMSSRFVPLSYEKPKGLLRVNGQVLVERQICQLKEAGISDITLVVGYMKEQFFYLQQKYGVSIVTNEDYYRYNNTSTLMCVPDKLSNTYICSSDNYFKTNVFNSYEYSAYYSTLYANGPTDEWCVKTDRRGRIIDATIGGRDSWYMLGHVYFDKNFSEKFLSFLKADYKNELTKKKLWEEVYIDHIKHLDMYAKHFDENDILEFDSLDDLRKFDKDYLENTNSRILKNICNALRCKESEITEISTINNSPSGITFKFSCKKNTYIYRHPDIHSDEYINYKYEQEAMQIAKELGLYSDLVYIDSEEFWKISYYKETKKSMCYDSPADVSKALAFIKKLHVSNKVCECKFDVWKSIQNMIKRLSKSSRLSFTGFTELHERISILNKYIKTDNFEHVMCNNNFYDGNIFIDDDGNTFMTDWKYAGISDPYNDLGTFICCSNYSYDKAVSVIDEYHDNTTTFEQKRHAIGCIALSSYHWFIWAIYQDSYGTPIGNNTYKWYLYAIEFCDKALMMYKNN